MIIVNTVVIEETSYLQTNASASMNPSLQRLGSNETFSLITLYKGQDGLDWICPTHGW
jgi:hypothetical protein